MEHHEELLIPLIIISTYHTNLSEERKSIVSQYIISMVTCTNPQSSTSLWDRLAQQETISSATLKGKQVCLDDDRVEDISSPKTEKKTTNAFFDRIANTETFATVNLKKRESIHDTILVEQEERMPQTPTKKTTSDFFDRIANTETFAMAERKGMIVKTPPPDNSPPSTSKQSPLVEKKTTNDFFDRMANTETFATAERKNKVKFISSRTSSRTTAPARPEQKTTSDFFVRMSKTQTVSSAQKKRGKILEIQEDQVAYV